MMRGDEGAGAPSDPAAGRLERAMESVNSRLREQVVDLEALLEVAPVGIAFSDTPDCREIFMNSHGARIMRLDPRVPPAGEAEAPYRFYQQGRLVPAEELPLQKVWRTGEAVRSFRARYENDDGVSFEFQMAAAPLYDEQGEIQRVVGVFDDISAMVKAQSDAERRARQQDYVASLGARSLRGERFEHLCASVPREIAEVLAADFVKLLEHRPASGDFLLRGSHGFCPVPESGFVVPGGARSQAGLALETGEPIFVEDMASDPRFAGLELLSSHGVRSGLSVAIGDSGWPLGVLGVHSRSVRFFDEHDVRFLQAVANVLAATIQRDENERHQEVLLAELQHRVKNSLATVQAIASLSFRKSDGNRQELATFRERIRSLAAAHDLLFKSGWRAIGLAEIVASQLAPYEDIAERIRVEEGPPVMLASNAAMEMAMILHELAANALKYGAWRGASGEVAIAWRLEGTGDPVQRLEMEWRESGGPAVREPRERGVGMALINSAFRGIKGASVAIDFGADGVLFRLSLPLGRPGERPTAIA